MIFSRRCPPHKFRPRYDEVPRDMSQFEELSVRSEGAFRDFATLKRYVGDVCEKCGQFVQRPDDESTREDLTDRLVREDLLSRQTQYQVAEAAVRELDEDH